MRPGEFPVRYQRYRVIQTLMNAAPVAFAAHRLLLHALLKLACAPPFRIGEAPG